MANKPVKSTTPVQPALPGTEVEQPSPAVRGKLIAVSYVKPIYEKDSSDNQFISLELSLPLVKQHAKLLPEEIVQQWKHLQRGGIKGVTGIEIDPHAVSIHLVPDDEATVDLEYVKVEKAALMAIEETGKGQAEDVIRFSFRLKHSLPHPELCRFADTYFGKMIWIEMAELEPRLIKKFQQDEARDAEEAEKS